VASFGLAYSSAEHGVSATSMAKVRRSISGCCRRLVSTEGQLVQRPKDAAGCGATDRNIDHLLQLVIERIG